MKNNTFGPSGTSSGYAIQNHRITARASLPVMAGVAGFCALAVPAIAPAQESPALDFSHPNVMVDFSVLEGSGAGMPGTATTAPRSTAAGELRLPGAKAPVSTLYIQPSTGFTPATADAAGDSEIETVVISSPDEGEMEKTPSIPETPQPVAEQPAPAAPPVAEPPAPTQTAISESESPAPEPAPVPEKTEEQPASAEPAPAPEPKAVAVVEEPEPEPEEAEEAEEVAEEEAPAPPSAPEMEQVTERSPEKPVEEKPVEEKPIELEASAPPAPPAPPEPPRVTAELPAPGETPPPPPDAAPVPETAPVSEVTPAATDKDPAPSPAPSPAQSPAQSLASLPPAGEDTPGTESTDVADGYSMRVVFAAEQSKLPPEARENLSALADGMNNNETLRLQLLAYAGGDGASSSAARRLSLSRALAVRSFLIEKGVRSTRIDVRALGNKTTDPETERVDISVIER